MNYTAAVLATATAFLIGCGASTMETGGTADTYPNWEGLWKRETGPAEISARCSAYPDEGIRRRAPNSGAETTEGN